MAIREKAFRPKVTVEALLYVLHKLQRPATVHELLKIQYFADKQYLSRYGALSSGDRYHAMEFGPVASGTYDLLKAAGKRARQVPQLFIELAADAFDGSAYPKVQAKRAPDEDMLAPAFKETLDAVIAECGSWDFSRRVKESHDTAWDEARARWNDTGDSGMSLSAIAETLSNSDEVLAHLAC